MQLLHALAAALLLATARDGESFRYRFDSRDELDDFEVVAGAWSVSTGSLWCTSKGAREELRWRRDLTPSGTARLRMAGAGSVAIALGAGRRETLVRLDRAAARVAVEFDGEAALERPFEAPAAGALRLAVAWNGDQVEVTVGEDEPLRVARPPDSPPFTRLALLAFRSQPRFEELEVAREVPRGRAGAGASQIPEEQRIAVELATRRFDEGDAAGAFDLLAKSLPAGGNGQPPALSEPAVLLLQKLGAVRAELRAKEPLRSRAAAATVAAKDGSATLVSPLRAGWSVQAHEIVRTDGPVFTLAFTEPALAVEVQRYDQKLKYWFGRDPRIVYCSGGGGPTLGRARADEQQEFHAKAVFTRPFGKRALEISGTATYEFELAWPDPADPARTIALREHFLLHRGDTWRISIRGSPLAFKLAQSDLDWLLATFRLAG